VDRGGNTIEFFDASGACALRYEKLKAWDATGRDLPADLGLEAGVVTIRVDDTDAVYPVTVDPLLGTPHWTEESDQIFAQFGLSVATAGDVNGDGYSDVIVGAPLFDLPEVNEGAAFVYFGSAAGLAITPSAVLDCDQSLANFGGSVATAGDVNGDGFDDVLVGARTYTNGENQEGAAFLYLGSASGLAPSPAWVVESNQAFAHLVPVATAGDVNGDGFGDVLVGASAYDNGQQNEGRAFLYLGSAAGLGPSPAWMAEPDQEDAWFGYSLATAGDMNADGFSDVIIGAPRYDDESSNDGFVFVYFGSPGGLAPTPERTWGLGTPNALYGASVAGAGDIDGDGFADVVVGAPFYGTTEEGAATLIRGRDWELTWFVQGDQAGAHLGTSVATAGDVNGDGYADVIVGLPDIDNESTDGGQVEVYLGSLAGLDSDADWAVYSSQDAGRFGVSVATAGDVNGDGFSDVIAGAPGYTNGQTSEGRAAVYQGSGDTVAFSFSFGGSGQDDAFFAGSVTSAGDLNGDGYSDFVVGARQYDGTEGAAFIYYGERDVLPVEGPRLETNQSEAWFGHSVAGAGDVNGDGYTEVIVGAYGATAGGRAYLYAGSPGGVATAPSWQAGPTSGQSGALFGVSVAGAGDVNGDGYADVVVGASGEGSGGRAYVYHGSSSGLLATPSWQADSGQGAASFAGCVAGAGDVNGDGYSDVIVGASLFDNGEANEGRAYLYLGSATGLGASPAWIDESDEAGAWFGFSVAGAGDVNGDGFSDVVVGTPLSGGCDEGAVFVYHGSAIGLAASPALMWRTGTLQCGSQFGFSVSSAGDVNGDGLSDIVAGAPFWDEAVANQGSAWLLHGPADSGSFQRKMTGTNDPSSSFGWSVATTGDLNGDGFADLLCGAPLCGAGALADPGVVSGFLGNGTRYYYDGVDRIARQVRAGDPAPIAPLGKTDYQNAFRIAANGRTAAGRGRVWLQWEVKPAGEPLDGTGIGESHRTYDTGIPFGVPVGSVVPMTELVAGLENQTRYRWRARVASRSPFFPRTPWLTMAYNAPGETDFRTAGSILGAGEAGSHVSGLRLEAVPVVEALSPVDLAYTLPSALRVRLCIYDVQGRERAVLDDGFRASGRHVVTWDGGTHAGVPLSAGVYLVRLEAGERSESRKLILAP
jgi:hypothetical protein